MSNLSASILAVTNFQLPTSVANNISYGLLVIIAVATVWCVAKVINGADMLERGEDGKKKIYSGIAIGAAPWLAVAAFKTVGLWDALGISLVPSSVTQLPPQLVDTIQLGMWAIIGIAVIWAIVKCIGGAHELEKGEDGKRKIFSGLLIGAAPWIAIGAMNLSGFWNALGLQLL